MANDGAERTEEATTRRRSKEREKGKAVLYSTHYMEEAENICDRVILIHKGKIIKEGTPKNIIKETKTTNLRDAFFTLIGGVSNE